MSTGYIDLWAKKNAVLKQPGYSWLSIHEKGKAVAVFVFVFGIFFQNNNAFIGPL